MPVRDAELANQLYRIGRAPDPLAWPPANSLGRYNDPAGSFRVLYATLERRAAFLETLQVYRPALADLARAGVLLETTEGDDPSLPLGVIPASFFSRLIAMFHPAPHQRWLDLRSPETHAVLRIELASSLTAAGYRGAFNFGELVGPDYTITQHLARWAFEHDFGGLVYPSAHDSSLTCWAVFDRAPIHALADPQPIDPRDRDLVTAANLFGLQIPDPI